MKRLNMQINNCSDCPCSTADIDGDYWCDHFSEMASRDLPHYPKPPSKCPLPDYKLIEPNLHYIISQLDGLKNAVLHFGDDKIAVNGLINEIICNLKKHCETNNAR